MRPYFETTDVTLYCGDCRDILPALPDGSVDAVVTDPPYCIVNKFGIHKNAAGNGSRILTFPCDDGITPKDIGERLGLSFRLCRKESSAFIFCCFDTAAEINASLRGALFTPKQFVWLKKCPAPAGPNVRWPSAFELAFFAYRPRAWFGDNDRKRTNTFLCDSYRHGQPGKVGHPNQKPLRLMRHIVSSIVPSGGLCIDPSAGSGSTGIAAMETGRRCILIEREKSYCKIIVKRLKEQAEKQPLLVGGAA